MNAVPLQKNAEDDLRSALREFIEPIRLWRRFPSDLSALVRATSALPLQSMAHWEKVVRNEVSVATHPKNLLGKLTEWMPSRILSWIDLCSWDGWERERTLRTLSGPAPNSFFLALAVRRLNDWVPQVRLAAREAIPKVAAESDPEDVAKVLAALLPSWMLWGRMEPADRQTVLELTALTEVTNALRLGVIACPSGPMPAVLTQMARTPVLDGHLQQIAQEAVQPAVRAAAFRALLAGKVRWVDGYRWKWTDVRYCEGRVQPLLGERPLQVRPLVAEILAAAAADKSSCVRRVAAEALIREMSVLGIAALPLAEQFASDKSRPVAERGTFALQQLGANRA